MFSKLLACLIVASAAFAATTPAPELTGTAVEVTGPKPTANAVNSADLALGADGVGEILLCVNAFFGAPCVDALYLENTCTNVPTNFQDNVSAVQPPGRRRVYTLRVGDSIFVLVLALNVSHIRDLNCGGQNIISIYPGYDNLADQGFNDRLTAWICSLNDGAFFQCRRYVAGFVLQGIIFVWFGWKLRITI
ncbi:hypothetical protein MSAN_01596500 [Mycena sanguinolenta]|uniref:Uncharacterized protein n=1 Tax=Mycena sanguinolenta TaxID=230812 RepID=A0A8H7CV53_9AGAR|nr:hypothetical protein MSAN_01596500 [Mycena sanguinolenta]